MPDPFEFIGKRILVVMLDDAFHQTFTLGQPVPGQEGTWIVTGRVSGDIPGVGFWLTIIEMSAPSGKSAYIAASGQPDATYLIRWERVMSARITPPDYKELGKIGFQLPMSKE